MTGRIENLPDELCSPPGMIGSLVDHMRRTAEYDLPELFLQTALSVVAVVTSRKLVDYRETCPNLLSVGLSPSGAGKEHGRRIAKRLLSDSALLGAESFTSGAAIMRSLEQRPAMLALVDEALQ